MVKLPDGDITIKGLQDYIKQKDYHPNNKHAYFLKLIEEVGELSEAINKEMRMEEDGNIVGTINEELYDILYYIVGLANVYDVDLEKSVRLKEAINEVRYAVR